MASTCPCSIQQLRAATAQYNQPKYRQDPAMESTAAGIGRHGATAAIIGHNNGPTVRSGIGNRGSVLHDVRVRDARVFRTRIRDRRRAVENRFMDAAL